MAANLIDDLRAALPPGYDIADYLTRGGQGAVFVGKADDRDAAIKVFNPHGDPRRLSREIEVLQSLDHPYLVKIIRHDLIELQSMQVPVVAYEFHAGGDLSQYAGAVLDIKKLSRIAYHVSQAVATLWDRRIVHRDIKPANIVASTSGEFVLVDVGLAKHLDRSNITAPGGAPGTEGYKSPEQAAGRGNLTIHSDWYSLGITLYQLAANRHPFRNAQYLIGRQSPQRLSELRQDLPDKFCRAIHRMLQVSPSRRGGGFVDLFAELCED